jgi:sugar lactone lactonase YvrE
VTIPRWLPGVPATLLRVNPATQNLVPFPSYEANALGSGWLTYVQSMEIDSRGWMWILEVGRLNIFSSDLSSIVNLQPKLVIYDLVQRCVLRTHVFPNSVFPKNDSFANDIVVDETRGLAFMTDTWSDGGIIVYDYSANLSRRWDRAEFRGIANATIWENGMAFSNSAPSDGIALSPDFNFVYFCAMSSPLLYEVSAKQLADFSLPNSALKITKIGKKGISDGMAFAKSGVLYFGSNEENALVSWNVSAPFSSATIIYSDAVTNEWVDTFAFDGDALVWVSNRLLRFFHGNLSTTEANFRILSVPVDSVSYVESGDPQPPSAECAA